MNEQVFGVCESNPSGRRLLSEVRKVVVVRTVRRIRICETVSKMGSSWGY